MERLKSYCLGDMKADYVWEPESKNVGLWLLPSDMEPLAFEKKRQSIDCMVQVKLVGDIYVGDYSGGFTLRQSESSRRLQYNLSLIHI